MNGAALLLLVLVVLVIWWLARRNRPGRPTGSERYEDDVGSSGPEVVRDGKSVPADEVFFAGASGDVQRMEAAVKLPTRETDRHFLLLHLCGEMYRQRKNQGPRAKFLQYAKLHLAEFPRLAPALKRDLQTDTLPRVPTYQMLATVLTEDGAFEEAIDVCREAIKLGLSDGTKSGFEGRIARIEKKRRTGQSTTT